MPASKKAIALGYSQEGETLPKVLAKGQGFIADDIIKKALSFDINIFSNETLANALMKLELNDDIPIELFQSVAELFAWLHQVEHQS